MGVSTPGGVGEESEVVAGEPGAFDAGAEEPVAADADAEGGVVKGGVARGAGAGIAPAVCGGGEWGWEGASEASGEGFKEERDDGLGGLFEVGGGPGGTGLDDPGFGAGAAGFCRVAGGPADRAVFAQDVLASGEAFGEGGHDGPAGSGGGGAGGLGHRGRDGVEERGGVFGGDGEEDGVERGVGGVFAS